MPYRTTQVLRECRLQSPLAPAVPAAATEAGEQRAATAFGRYFRPTRGVDKHEILISHGNTIRYLVSCVLTGSADHWWRMYTLNCGIMEIAVWAGWAHATDVVQRRGASAGPPRHRRPSESPVGIAGILSHVGLIPAVSCERRNILAIIRVTDSGEARCSVDEQTMEGD